MHSIIIMEYRMLEVSLLLVLGDELLSKDQNLHRLIICLKYGDLISSNNFIEFFSIRI